MWETLLLTSTCETVGRRPHFCSLQLHLDVKKHDKRAGDYLCHISASQCKIVSRHLSTSSLHWEASLLENEWKAGHLLQYRLCCACFRKFGSILALSALYAWVVFWLHLNLMVLILILHLEFMVQVWFCSLVSVILPSLCLVVRFLPCLSACQCWLDYIFAKIKVTFPFIYSICIFWGPLPHLVSPQICAHVSNLTSSRHRIHTMYIRPQIWLVREKHFQHCHCWADLNEFAPAELSGDSDCGCTGQLPGVYECICVSRESWERAFILNGSWFKTIKTWGLFLYNAISFFYNGGHQQIYFHAANSHHKEQTYVFHIAWFQVA